MSKSTPLSLSRILFGDVQFEPDEEFAAFRYKFLIIAMVAAVVATLLFIVGAYGDLNAMSRIHMVSMHVFTATALGSWLVLRGHKRRFHAVAWSYEIVAMGEYTSALLYAPQDELRLLWFYTNVPGVFMLLGSRAGWFITAVTIAILVAANGFTPSPYSPPALMTAIVSLLYLAVFFHVYGDRSISYFKRMLASNQALERLASHDPLTGVMNARAYGQACERGIRAAARTGRPYSVLFIDLDHFKSINDRHGHDAGDAVLSATARCIGEGIRATDALGRIGGEEFSVFLPDTAPQAAMTLAESLRQRIESLCPAIEGGTLRVTASIGVASSTDHHETMKSLQQRADQAMYAAKAQGRNRVSFLEAA
jgi:diguanylate cyclase (GGDEF)-like protein